ncbi:hypothetical protein [Azospirillum sp. sgz301742]
MTMNRHLALGAAALAAASLALGITLHRGAPPHPLAPAMAASPAVKAASPPRVEERKTDDDGLSATGMEHVPVFD